MTIEDLKETAALAHINLDENELGAIFPAFKEALKFFDIMQAAELAIEPNYNRVVQKLKLLNKSNITTNSNFFRPDIIISAKNNEDLINNADERDGRFIVIPNVLER